MIEVNICGMKNLPDGSASCLESDHEIPDFYSVYVMDDCFNITHDEDFDTLEQAEQFFNIMMKRHPGANENIYSMGRPKEAA